MSSPDPATEPYPPPLPPVEGTNSGTLLVPLEFLSVHLVAASAMGFILAIGLAAQGLTVLIKTWHDLVKGTFRYFVPAPKAETNAPAGTNDEDANTLPGQKVDDLDEASKSADA